jgi:arylsulfatase A-like enzyme
MRSVLILILTVSCTAQAAAESVQDAQAAQRPNFIIMMTDDQRADALSCAGNTILKTPNIDRLAAEGMRFKNMFVTNALCAPSRATLMTGLYSHAHTVIDNKENQRRVPQEIPLLSDQLRAAGYEVAFCGKSHQAGAFRDRTWDYYFGYRGQGQYLNPLIAEGTNTKDERRQGYMDDLVTDKAVAWLRQKREKPYCLFLFFKAPHRSWVRAPRHKDLFDDVTVPKPALWDADRNAKPRAFADAQNLIGAFDDVKDYQKFIKDYYATIAAVDDNVGKVLEALDELKQADNTLVMYTSDNGFFTGEWQAFDKRLMHEPSIRVPLLVRYPKLIKPGSTSEKMVINVDIAPTVLAAAGVKSSHPQHGLSVLPLLKGEQVDWRKDWLYAYYEFPGPHSVRKNRGIRTEQHKLIHYFEGPEEWELYDLVKDPQELVNLHGKPEHAALTERLKSRLEELRREVGENVIR